MELDKLKFIFKQFQHAAEFKSFHELASGHINDTYLIKTQVKPYFVLQRINHVVFKDIPGLIENKVQISEHLQKKLSHLSAKKRNRRFLKVYPTKTGHYFYQSTEGGYWNLMRYIDKSVTYETVPNIEIAYECGRLLGQFLTLTNDFDASKLTEVIPKFHDMSFRYEEFKKAKQSATSDRLGQANSCIHLVENAKEDMHRLQYLKESGAIKTRVTHNDTKVSNALFNRRGKGLCLIDTDTVMPGIVHYDFGDAIRTICNTAAEDETDLDSVVFNKAYYKAYTKGFLKKMESSITDLERKYLPLGVKTMIFIMGLRFLTDYLNNDLYYKTTYDHHNLDRAKNQFKLVESFTEKIHV